MIRFNNNTFQKKTFIGVYSNYDRHQPDEYKKGLMETLSINLSYVEGTSEELRDILRSHKIICNFFIENTLCKLLCKLRD